MVSLDGTLFKIKIMSNHYALTDLEFEQKFERGNFDPEWFSHEAHIRLAWIHINKYGLEKAIENVCLQLVNFVTQLGVKDKFNKTLTVAAIKAVHHFMLKSKSHNFEGFIAEYPRLKSNFKDLMSCHYNIDIYSYEKAKREFIEPDLLPFD